MSIAVFERSQSQPIFVLIAAVIILLMFYLGAQPIVAGVFHPPWDKLAHFVAYATLTVLLRLGLGRDQPWLLVVLIGIIGSVDEWRQLSIPGRSAELADLVTDIAAAVVAILACEWHEKNRKLSRPALPEPGHSN
jgi:VanZ family protein